jgi:subtilisin family serine protease
LALVLLVCFHQSACAIQEPDWGITHIGASCVWDKNRDNHTDSGANAGGTIVAIIDDGIDLDHDDLKDNIAGGRSFTLTWPDKIVEGDDYGADSSNQHGTECAGILASVDNQNGLIGVAPKARIYMLRPSNRHELEIAYAINYSACVLGAKVLSMSFFSGTEDSIVSNACENAYGNGTIIFCCSGNNKTNPRGVGYPAANDWAVAVGAIYGNNTRLSDSCYGPELDFVAPGYLINTTAFNPKYVTANGTSMACPYVAGVAALIMASIMDPDYDVLGGKEKEWDPIEVESKMRDTALDLGTSGYDDEYGYGLVNAWWACQRPEGNLNYDTCVDIADIGTVGLSFGSEKGDINWNPVANFNLDNYTDIFDIVFVALNFGDDTVLWWQE